VIDREEIKRLRFDEKLGATEIAKQLGISRPSVYRVLSEMAA
jgi:DNA-binding transcriptional regulator LsrR (DeoR family)